jgi:ferritin
MTLWTWHSRTSIILPSAFLQWFVDEQVEEEATMGKLLSKVQRIGSEGHGILLLDQELAGRSFTPPAK